MADFLNIPDCGGTQATGNTGIPLCDAIANIPNGLIGLDPGVEFTAADRASKSAFLAKLKTFTRNPRGSRAYPLFRITNFEDQTKEATKISLGNLTTAEIQGVPAVPAMSFQHRIGELFHKELFKIQTQNLLWLLVDNFYLVLGTETSGGGFTGYSATEFLAGLMKMGTPANASYYPFSLQFADADEFMAKRAFFQMDSTIKTVTGNRNVDITLASQVSNVANISLISTGGKNLGDLYPSLLADITAYTLKNTQTGADVTITSATYNSTTGLYAITADSTAFTALTTGQKMTLDLVATAALSTLGADGYESTGPVYLVK